MATPVAAAITVAARFNGPLRSGNGGYSASLLAAGVDGPAAVNPRSPVPLERPLDVVSGAGGTARALAIGRALAIAARG